MTDLTKLFNPASVAVVGASPNAEPGRFSYLQFLAEGGFKGDLYPVNPKYTEIIGYKCYPSLKEIPAEVIDMAILMVPADMCPKVLDEIPKGKLRFTVIFTSGFAEVGNHKTADALKAVARKKGIRIVGPNCMGIFSRPGRLRSFSDQRVDVGPGKVAVLAQSGGNALNMYRLSHGAGVDFEYVVSYGNQLDLQLEDYLDFFEKDKQIKAIALYMEDTKDGRRFLKTAQRITRKKPIVVWKGGRSEQGAKAAASHTAAQALPGKIWEGIVRQAGLIEAMDLADTEILLRALLSTRLPAGPGVGFIVAGGGNAVSFTDMCSANHLTVPALQPETIKKLQAVIPEVNTSVVNPVDVGAAAFHPKIMKQTMMAMAADPGIDCLINALYVNPIMTGMMDHITSSILPVIQEIKDSVDVPVMVVLQRTFENNLKAEKFRTELIDRMIKLNITWFNGFTTGTRMIRALFDYYTYLETRGNR